MMKCPGQDTQYWKPGAIYEVACPECGKIVEFFKDDTSRKCGHCGHRFVNPKLDFGCAAYCQYAEQCLGTLPAELVAQQDNLLKERVAIEVKRYLKQDFKSIGHAMRTARYAEAIVRTEGGNMALVLCAAYLYGLGAQNGNGTKAAAEILGKLKAGEALIDQVSAILKQKAQPDPDPSTEFRIVFDADRIATLREAQKRSAENDWKWTDSIADGFMTEGGKKTAESVLKVTI